MQGGERTVAKAEKSNIELALVALDALALHVHLALRCDDGFDIVGLGPVSYTHLLANDRGVLYAHVHVQLCYPIPCSLYGTEYRCAAQTGQE